MKGKFAYKNLLQLIIALTVLIVGFVYVRYNMYYPIHNPTEEETPMHPLQDLIREDGSQLESLYKLCKVWGYVKYHHPSVVSMKVDWDEELLHVLPKVLRAGSQDEVNEVLYRWLKAFPVVTEDHKSDDYWPKYQEEHGRETLDSSWIKDASFLGKDLSAYLSSLSELYLSNRYSSYASFNIGGIVNFDQEKKRDFEEGNVGLSLLALFRFWNMYEYYSPNLSLTREPWDEVLLEAIPHFAAVKDYRSYVLEIAKLTAKTGDPHIAVHDEDNILANFYGKYYLPCDILILDGKVVVFQVKEGETELQPGDILVEIDGGKLADRIEEQRAYQALAEPDKFLLHMRHLLLEAEGKEAELTVLRGDETRAIKVKTLKERYKFNNPIKNGLMEGENIGYIDPSKLKEGELEELMWDFRDTKGLIVDLRHYPSVFIVYPLSEYINPESRVFSEITLPNPALPGAFYVKEMKAGKGNYNEKVKESTPIYDYQGRVILLMDERSISQTEFTLMALRQAPKATVIGSPSIGADGNVILVNLPGEVVFAYSGLGVYTPEGGQTQQIGLKPDIECYQTAAAIREGRDTLIEKAIELIR